MCKLECCGETKKINFLENGIQIYDIPGYQCNTASKDTNKGFCERLIIQNVYNIWPLATLSSQVTRQSVLYEDSCSINNIQEGTSKKYLKN